MRFSTLLVCLLVTLVVVCTASAQQGLPSSKATADINTLVRCNMSSATYDDTITVPGSCVNLFTGAAEPVDANGFVEIASKKVKLSNSQSLFVSPSLVTGLYTQTRTKTTTGGTSTAQAMGGVYLRAVLVPDAGGPEIVAAPLTSCAAGILGCAEVQPSKWGVILDSRVQTLTQELSACLATVGGIAGTCSFTSTIDLVLQTTSAHTFNFVFPSVGQGTYTLVVKAAVASGASIIGSGTAVGAAAFGVGSVTAESVRLVHDFAF